MGISGLLPLLKSIQRVRHIRDWKGKTIGVDAYGWLHRGTIPCAIELALGKPTTKYVDYVMKQVKMLQFFGVTPYLVFDGDYLPSKASTEADRERKRAKSKAAGLELLKLGKTSQAYLHLQKAVDVNPTMARHIIEACKKVGVKCIVAPYEADAQMFYLEKMGVIDAVLSEDSDLLVFGVKSLITKLDQYGDCIELNRENFTACKEVTLAGWTDAEFRHMCILSGCDYLENIPSIGLKTAHRLVKKHRNIDKILRSLKFDGKFTVPPGYLEAFRRADLTFQHQRVFCPLTNTLVMCNEPEEPLDDEHLIYIGYDLDSNIARGVACGDLDPMTKGVIEIPHHLPQFSQAPGWTPRQPLQGGLVVAKNNKIITSFFKPKEHGKILPRTPLRTQDMNIHQSRFAFSAPVAASTPTKRSLSTACSTNKKLRMGLPEGFDDDPRTGEKSAFFKGPCRRTMEGLQPQPQFSTTLKENVTPKTPQLPNTPDQDGPPDTNSRPSSLDTPVKTKISAEQTASVRQTFVTEFDTESVQKVAEGWKDRYSFKARPSNTLSAIIEKQRMAPLPKRMTPLQRLGFSSTAQGPKPFLKKVNPSVPKPRGRRPFTVDTDSSGASQEDEWPEFVGVKKSSSQCSSTTATPHESQEEITVSRGMFDDFAFKGR